MIERLQIAFPVHPWLRDHHFLGLAVLPMVMAIDFLAALILEKFPEIDLTKLEKATFPKLLALPGDNSLPLLIELERLDDRRLRAAMFTRKSGAVSRLLRHAEVIFGGPCSEPCGEPFSTALCGIPDSEASVPTQEALPAANGAKEPCRAIACEKIYAELVPFGKNFRTLHDQLYLQGDTASGTLIAPDLDLDLDLDPPSFCPALPNPFLLDGAMHAACVHGQTFCGFVPFPAGFAAIEVENASKLQMPGHVYETRCCLIEKTVNELRYDLGVRSDGGAIKLSGLVMRDVSGGAIKPPPWIRQIP